MIDLGEVPFDPDCLVWIAPIERTENPVNIFMDRVIFTLKRDLCDADFVLGEII